MTDKIIKNTKLSFSKEQKRTALLEFAKGKSNSEILKIILKDNDINSSDKKYFAKLLHKWRSNMYKNKHMLNFQCLNLDDNLLNYEIRNLSGPDRGH